MFRYSPQALHAEFGPAFRLRHSEAHVTPAGAAQKFVYCRMQKQVD